MRWRQLSDGPSSGDDSSSSDVSPDMTCSPVHDMEVRVNLDNLTEIKQLEESFQARFFFQAWMKDISAKKNEQVRQCCKFIQKYIVPDETGIRIEIRASGDQVTTRDAIKKKAAEQLVWKNYLDEDIQHDTLWLTIQNARVDSQNNNEPKLELMADFDGKLTSMRICCVIAEEFCEQLNLRGSRYDSQELSGTTRLGVPCSRRCGKPAEQMRSTTLIDQQSFCPCIAWETPGRDERMCACRSTGRNLVPVSRSTSSQR